MILFSGNVRRLEMSSQPIFQGREGQRETLERANGHRVSGEEVGPKVWGSFCGTVGRVVAYSTRNCQSSAKYIYCKFFLKETRVCCFITNGPTPPSFSFIFGLFKQTSIQFFTINQCEKCQFHPVYGPGIRTHDLLIMSHLP